MSDSKVGTNGRSGDEPRRSETERHSATSSRHDSSSRHVSRHDRDRRDDDERREGRSHSHREDRHRGQDGRRHRDEGEDRRSRRRDDGEDRYGSSSSSKRHRDGEDRDSKRHRRHWDDDASRSRRSPPRQSPPPPPSTSTSNPLNEDIDDDAPNLAPSGLLAAESNTLNGVALKYHEPPEARKPKRPWRLYCFKDAKQSDVLHLASQSAYLLGRDRTVVDIPLDHESCSKQHAVLQFRQTISTNEFGDKTKRVQPFLIDLESSNGSYVNEEEVPTSRYYQLRSGDTLTFGASTREYVLLDEGAA